MINRIPIRTFSALSPYKSIPRASQRCLRKQISQPAKRICLRPFSISRSRNANPIQSNLSPPLQEPVLPNQSSPNPTSQPQAKPKRSLRPYIYATIFFIFGATAGQYIRMVLAPPALPAAGTKADNNMVEYIQRQAEKLPIVQSLSTDPNWTSHEAYTSLADSERSHRLTTGPLAGARALGGFQRIFYNKETGETITVIWFGGVIAGWPGVTHGGVTATIMDEALGRCAIKLFPSNTGVTANLELNYLKPIVTNSFYVIRAVPEQGHTDRKAWVNGRLEMLNGAVCVEAKALFVVPKKFNTRPLGGNF